MSYLTNLAQVGKTSGGRVGGDDVQRQQRVSQGQLGPDWWVLEVMNGEAQRQAVRGDAAGARQHQCVTPQPRRAVAVAARRRLHHALHA